MWTEKTEIEKIEEERLEKIKDDKSRFKKSFRGGIIIFSLVAVTWTIASLTIGIPQGRYIPASPRDVIKISELPEYLPEFLRLAAILGFVTFLMLFFFRSKTKTTTLMCDKCHTSKNFDTVTQCGCGGHFKNIDNFKWIED